MAKSRLILSSLAELAPHFSVNRRFIGARLPKVAYHYLNMFYGQRNIHLLRTLIRSDSPRPSFTVSRHRDFSNSSDERETKYIDNTRRLRTLKCGRARRKWETRTKRVDASNFAKQNVENVTGDEENNARTIDQNTQSFERDSLDKDVPDYRSVSEILFGRPLDKTHREEYYRQYRRENGLKYPKTLEGWKTLFSEAWKDYLWTFEGFLIKDSGERDEYGNIIENDKIDGKDKNVAETLKEKASDVASEVASNVRKNVATIREESPKLLKMGQDITGITSKEELKSWVGEQLKLATECVGEFMKGYRLGRDEEVDKMLHQYFQELDDQKESGGKNSPDEEGYNITTKRERRTWGRRERRRKKNSTILPQERIVTEGAHA